MKRPDVAERNRILKRKHGICAAAKRTTEYRIWAGLAERCCNPNKKAWPSYGGRGIKICDRWRFSFENFLVDMGHRPSLGHALDRIDNNGDYCPENCRWATWVTQNNNRKDNIFLTLRGKTLTISQWAREKGLKLMTLNTRLNRGWDIESALETPVGTRLCK